MKRTINGKRYDTSTAKLIKEWSSLDRYGYPYPSTDNRYDVVGLYEKRTGEHFLHRECVAGEDLAPIDEDEANRLKGLDFSHDPEWDNSAAIDISDEFGYFGEWGDNW